MLPFREPLFFFSKSDIMQTLSNVLVLCFAIGIDGFSPLPFAPIHSLYGRSSGELLVEAQLLLF